MIIILAYFLDIFIGDMKILRWPVHALEIITAKSISILKKVKNLWVTGLLLVIILYSITFAFSLAFLLILRKINSTMEFLGSVYLIFNSFSIKASEKRINNIYDKLYENDIYLAEKKLNLISNKQIKNTGEKDLIKTTIAVTAQNTLNDFFAPLLYAFFGGGIFALLYKCTYILYYTLSKTEIFDEVERNKINFFPHFILNLFNFLPSILLYLILPLASGWKKIKYLFFYMWHNKSKKFSIVKNVISEIGFNIYLFLNEEGEIKKEPEIDDILESINYMYRISYLCIVLFTIMYIFK
ncbi:cobalamin biosynthesis protein [Candidatus Desantisbacteria bacterium]|nr:cobalamin biosynthesis protein [Candidatus Desantisbacteria bacterium]